MGFSLQKIVMTPIAAYTASGETVQSAARTLHAISGTHTQWIALFAGLR